MTRRNRVRIGSGWTGVASSMALGGGLLATLAMAAAPSGLPPGEYIYDHGAGSLKVKGKPGQAQTFDIHTIGGNAHSCTINGQLKGLEGHGGDATNPSMACTIALEVAGPDVTVSLVTDRACRNYCGARGMFEGHYTLPTPECRPAAVTATRTKFKQRYDAKDYAGANELLAGLLKNCTPVLWPFDEKWIRNDLALSQHHAGDDAACRATLQPLEELAGEDPERLGSGEPSYADILKRLAKAARTNLALCAPKKTGN